MQATTSTVGGRLSSGGSRPFGKEGCVMSDYQIISVIIGILGLLISLFGIIVKLIIAYVDAKTEKRTDDKNKAQKNNRPGQGNG